LRLNIGLPHPTPKKVFRIFIHKIQIAAFHTPSHQNAIGVFHKVNKVVFSLFNDRVIGLRIVANPPAGIEIISQIFS